MSILKNSKRLRSGTRKIKKLKLGTVIKLTIE